MEQEARDRHRDEMVNQLVSVGIDRSDAVPAVDIGIQAWDNGFKEMCKTAALLEDDMQHFFALVVCGFACRLFADKTSEESAQVIMMNAISKGDLNAINTIREINRELSND